MLRANVQEISEKSSLRSKGEKLLSNLYRRLTVKREAYYDVRLLSAIIGLFFHKLFYRIRVVTRLIPSLVVDKGRFFYCLKINLMML